MQMNRQDIAQSKAAVRRAVGFIAQEIGQYRGAQSRLAELTGISRGHLSDMGRDNNDSVPGIDKAVAISQAVGGKVTVAELRPDLARAFDQGVCDEPVA